MMSSRSPNEQEAGQRYHSVRSDRLTMPREKEPSRRTLVAASRDIAIVVFALGYFPRRSINVIGFFACQARGSAVRR